MRILNAGLQFEGDKPDEVMASALHGLHAKPKQ